MRERTLRRRKTSGSMFACCRASACDAARGNLQGGTRTRCLLRAVRNYLCAFSCSSRSPQAVKGSWPPAVTEIRSHVSRGRRNMQLT